MRLSFEGAERTGAGITRRARAAWRGGELALEAAVPPDFPPAQSQDLATWAPLALLCALRRGEDLELDGMIDAGLHARLPEIAEIVTRWVPGGREPRIRGGSPFTPPPPGEERGCFLSMGVDSLHAAGRAERRGELDRLVWVQGWDPRHGEAVRAEEPARVAETAAAFGRPLVTVRSNVLELARDLMDFEDAAGAALASAAHAVSGVISHMRLGATENLAFLGPNGTHPVLDQLYAADGLRLEHGGLLEGRMGKIAWLAQERPDLLPFIRTCLEPDRLDNCGVCAKCLFTMAALRVCGALERATLFPGELDLEKLAALQMAMISSRHEMWIIAEAARAAGENDVAEAVEASVVRSNQQVTRILPSRTYSFRMEGSRVLLEILAAGRDEAGPAVDALGLVRTLDARGGRHLYAVGTVPPGELEGELGALRPPHARATVPMWIDAEGRPWTPGLPPAPTPPDAQARARWLGAPLTWRDRGISPAERLRAVGRRATAPASAPAPPAEPPSGTPVGYLHEAEGWERVPLWAAWHPMTGDLLLSRSRWEAVDAGYAEPVLLGYLDDRAPVTGRLGDPEPRPAFWSSGLGLRRDDRT